MRGMRFTGCVAAVLAALALSQTARAEEAKEFSFQRENVLGTSLELFVTAPSEKQAEACEARVMQEIGRLNKILSTYDPQSEISRLNATRQPVKCSPELVEVLRACEGWRRRSGGAFNPQLGKLIAAWKQAEMAGRVPEEGLLTRLAAEANQPACELDGPDGSVRRLTDARLNVNSLAKGYILDKAVAAAAQMPGMQRVLLNIGGDIRVWTREGFTADKAWTIGVADPRCSYDNVPPRIRLRLANAGVATSGNYERYYTIGGRRYSHIFDPRTGRPADGVASSTTVAPDSATANALATTLCVLGPQEGLKLAKSIPGVECFIVTADGKEYASEGWRRLAAAVPGLVSAPAPSKWPAGFQVVISMNLKFTIIRPYVAFWIEDTAGKPVRTLEVWGKKEKYLRMMTSWWKVADASPALVTTVTRATRLGGKYHLLWDGTDDKGNPLPQGDYVVRVELYRKEGKRFDMRGEIKCQAEPATGKVPDCPEAKDMDITYGPKEK